MKRLSTFLPPAAVRAVPPALPADPLRVDLTALHALAQTSPYVFASPLGPFQHRGHLAWLSRFVFFGPCASDDSWRLAFHAGLDHRDVRSSRALLRVVERLAEDARDGHGLNLTFFPRVAAANSAGGLTPRGLDREHWPTSRVPEIELLRRDARQRAYHGFVRLESAPADQDIPTVCVSDSRPCDSPDVEIISTEETTGFSVRFERADARERRESGPLSMVGDVGVVPFEMVLRIPSTWTDAAYDRCARSILIAFIRRYRAFQAYGGHL